MAVRTPPSSRIGARAAAIPRLAAVPASAVAAAALPLIFLHVDFQPGFTVGIGPVSAHAVLADFAVLAVALAALATGLRHGFAPLRAGWPVWLTGSLFVAMIGAASAYPRLWDGAYDVSTHAVTAAKFGEYALLAPAVPLLLRRRRDLELVLASLVAWTTLAAVVGVLQFFGVDIFHAWSAGRRQPSFLGHYDLGALAGASLVLALACICFRPRIDLPRPLLVLAGLAGAVGLALSGSSAAGLGLGVAAAAMLVVAFHRRRLTLRRALAAILIVGAVGGGILVMRSGDVDQFIRFLGIRRQNPSAQEYVQTYVQRTMLAYIGWRIFLDNPIGGAGWQASSKEEQVYGRYLSDARREFPEAPPIAFPSPEHPYGTQNAYVQALADLGAIGLVLMLLLFASGLGIAGRAALHAPPDAALPGLLAAAWLLLAMGTWAAVGLVAGIPLDALTWMALGLAAAAAAGARRAAA